MVSPCPLQRVNTRHIRDNMCRFTTGGTSCVQTSTDRSLGPYHDPSYNLGSHARAIPGVMEYNDGKHTDSYKPIRQVPFQTAFRSPPLFIALFSISRSIRQAPFAFGTVSLETYFSTNNLESFLPTYLGFQSLCRWAVELKHPTAAQAY